MSFYAKALVHALATGLAALLPFLVYGHVTPLEWVNVAIVGVGSLSVYVTPNVLYYKYAKSVIAVLTAGLTVLASVIVGGVTPGEWLQIAMAALGALGVYQVRNAAKAANTEVAP